MTHIQSDRGNLHWGGFYPLVASSRATLAHHDALDQGPSTSSQFEHQAFEAAELTLATADIIYWNTMYMGRALEHLRARGRRVLAHVAPLGRRHISLTGDYSWQNAKADLDRDGYRSLNIGAETRGNVA